MHVAFCYCNVNLIIMAPDITVSIVNWNTRDYLKQCLESVRKYSGGVACEVFVVDNASIDGSSLMVKKEFPEVRLIENRTNLCYAKANNQVFAEARGRYFLLLNPDVILQEGALEKMVHFLDVSPLAGAVAPRYLNPDRSFQRFYRRFPRFSLFVVRRTVFAFLIPRRSRDRIDSLYQYEADTDKFDNVVALEQPASSCLLLRKELFKEEKLLDERFPLFFNDVDLCLRIQRRSFKTFFLPEAEVVHFQGRAVKQLDWNYEVEYLISWLRYHKKYDGWLVFLLAQSALVITYLVFSASNFFGVLFFRKSRAEFIKNITARVRIVMGRSPFA